MQWNRLANRILAAGNRRGGSAGNKLKMTLGLPVYVSLANDIVNNTANRITAEPS